MTVDQGDDALNRAAAEPSAIDAAGIAVDLHRLDGVASLVEVLQWTLECARRRCSAASLSIVRGATLRPWRPSTGDLRGGDTFPLNVGGRVVAVLFANPSTRSAAGAIDILTSYAGRALESVTLHKALGVVPPR